MGDAHDPPREPDPARAAERTLLAWNRSALALGVIAALAIRFGAVEDSAAGWVLGGALLGLAAVVLLGAAAAYRASLRRMAAREPLARPAAIRTAAAATTLTGVAAFALALTS